MSNSRYRQDIQGLRAIAVLAVIIFHLNPAWLPGGFVGVDIFLVISGFLIGSILLHKKTQPDYQLLTTLNYFYTSRIKRIAPAYFTMLILVSVLAAVLFLPADFATYRDGLAKAAYFNSNSYFASFGDYFAPASYEQPLLHTWSLAIEIQFYLLAPFMFLLLPRRFLGWVLSLSILCLTAYAEYQLRILGNEQATYYSLIARLPALLLGAWVALLIEKSNNIMVGVIKSYG
ncbi:acyltransferase family protein [Marinomonas primoryensis]|uniref:acyltransferase family protein n=1 Tax=Marinomonas primoryensis TaxID=178399 RepID=UPI0019551B1E|nr:acyltransferase [Marinomonas primoryensis]